MQLFEFVGLFNKTKYLSSGSLSDNHLRARKKIMTTNHKVISKITIKTLLVFFSLIMSTFLIGVDVKADNGSCRAYPIDICCAMFSRSNPMHRVGSESHPVTWGFGIPSVLFEKVYDFARARGAACDIRDEAGGPYAADSAERSHYNHSATSDRILEPASSASSDIQADLRIYFGLPGSYETVTVEGETDVFTMSDLGGNIITDFNQFINVIPSYYIERRGLFTALSSDSIPTPYYYLETQTNQFDIGTGLLSEELRPPFGMFNNEETAGGRPIDMSIIIGNPSVEQSVILRVNESFGGTGINCLDNNGTGPGVNDHPIILRNVALRTETMTQEQFLADASTSCIYFGENSLVCPLRVADATGVERRYSVVRNREDDTFECVNVNTIAPAPVDIGNPDEDLPPVVDPTPDDGFSCTLDVAVNEAVQEESEFDARVQVKSIASGFELDFRPGKPTLVEILNFGFERYNYYVVEAGSFAPVSSDLIKRGDNTGVLFDAENFGRLRFTAGQVDETTALEDIGIYVQVVYKDVGSSVRRGGYCFGTFDLTIRNKATTNPDPGKNWYPDRDGDGFGDIDAPADEVVVSVNQPKPNNPEGYVYVEDNTDCNDTLAEVNPAAEEVCNLIDDNCNGEIDENLPLCNIVDDVCVDDDGDQFVEGHISICPDTDLSGGDCDDANPLVFPGTPECLPNFAVNLSGEGGLKATGGGCSLGTQGSAGLFGFLMILGFGLAWPLVIRARLKKNQS